MGSYRHVRAIERGLEVLAELNRHNGATAAQISARTGIHRTTVYRMLDTLEELGYVRRSPSDQTHRLTLKVRSLSDGFDDDAWVTGLAAPILGALLREVMWPSDLSTFEENAMVIRETTHRFSRFSIHHAMVGRRLPVLTSAAGRAYLGACNERQVELVVDALATSGGADQELARDERYVERVLLETRRRGYGISSGEVESKIGSFALPVRQGERVLAAVNVIFFLSALSVERAAELYLPALRHAVSAIEAGLQKLPDSREDQAAAASAACVAAT